VLTSELMEEVRRLQIRTRRRVDDLFAGEYQSAFLGRGIEFAEVREYTPGDDVRAIDWNVTARAGKPFIKRYIEERQLTVMLCVDASASGLFGTVGRSKARLIAEAGAALAYSALRNNDRVGLLRFSDAVDLFVPPRKGPRHLLRLLRELLGSEPGGAGRAFPEALETLGSVLRQRAIVFVAADFLPPPGGDLAGIERPLARLARRHEVIALRVSDPREHALPRAGLISLRDPESGQRVLFDTASRRLRRRFEDLARDRRAASVALLRRVGVDVIDLSTDRPFGIEIERYFRTRERRRRRE
jgi:uncharacterized protein (DUF58 family)